MKKFLSFLLVALLAVSTAGAASITDNHFEGGKNLTKGSKHGSAGTLADLIMDLQDSTDTASLLATPLTGFSASAGTVTSADTILSALGNLAGNTQNLPVIANVLTGFSASAGTVAAADPILDAIEKLAGNSQNLPVIDNVLTGFVAGAGAVADTDSILEALEKLTGNTQNLEVIDNLLTGYVAGTAGTPVALAASDSVLQGLQKLDGNKAEYTESSFIATFDQTVGAKTVVVRKLGKQVTLEIPTGSTADGGGAPIASGATDISAAFRPAANLSFPVVVSDNAVLVFGKLVVSSAGQLSFTASAAGANFTDDAVAGFDRVAVSYTLP